MVRRFSDPVEVREVPQEGVAPARPDAFIWRGRLYVVREVLGRWRERRPWWRDAVADVAAGGGPAVPVLSVAAVEHEVWRVEASPGWSFAPGVYDLVHDLPIDQEGTREQWSLVRVAD